MSDTFIKLTTPNLSAIDVKRLTHITQNSVVSAVSLGKLIGSSVNSRTIGMTVSEVEATGTVTFSSTGPSNGETMVLAATTITFVSSGATGNQVNISTTPSVMAARLATLINTSASFTNICTATSSGAVVTITARPGSGVLGNKITLTENATNTAVSGSGFLADGDDGTTYTLTLG